jgi:carboxymethylenebutenolidase
MAGRAIAIGHEGFGGYLALPPSGRGPGLLLLADSVPDDGLHARADELAEEGYVVLAPDMSWRGPATTVHEHRALQDIAVAQVCLRTRPECSGKLAALGFGVGGRLVCVAATQLELSAAIAYCPPDLERLPNAIGCPLLVHFAEADERVAPSARASATAALTHQGVHSKIYLYPGCGGRFHERSGSQVERVAALMAYSRDIALLHATLGPAHDLSALWEEHTYQEFGARDAAATMRSMVAEPYVNHIPTMTGGVGHDDLLRFYRHHFIPQTPADTRLVPISRTVGADRLVDEMLFCFTHDIEIDWMLPGVPPTGRYVEIPLVAIVRFRGDKLYNEHIYWDQASVLVQIGLLDPHGLPVAGVETARKLLDESLPSNTLMQRWARSAKAG